MGAPMNDTAQTLADQLRLTVDYDQSLEAMIAAGHYDWTNSNITAQRFPMQGTGIAHVEFKLFHFDRYLLSEDAVAAIKTADAENPWEPAKIEHLLSFGVTHPDEQCRSPIIALGSAANLYDDRVVPNLDGNGAKRDLYLDWWNNGWSDDHRFLAVRNRSSGT